MSFCVRRDEAGKRIKFTAQKSDGTEIVRITMAAPTGSHHRIRFTIHHTVSPIFTGTARFVCFPGLQTAYSSQAEQNLAEKLILF
jgi:hypothetical protein